MSSINGVSSAGSNYQTNAQSPWQQRANDFKALQSALQSGDLSGAQQAFANLQQDGQGFSPASAKTSTAAASAVSSQGAVAIQALQSALSSGNLSAAQQSFATLKQDMQNAGRTSHHHRHIGGWVNGATQASNSDSGDNADQTVASALDLQA